MSKKVIVDIDETGQITLDGQGFDGKECHDIIDELRKKASAGTVSNKKKAEFYKQKVTVNTQNKVQS